MKDVLKIIDLPEATYHYHPQQFDLEDRDQEWKTVIRVLFEKDKGRYGYRQVHLELKALGYEINHKKVQHLMSGMELKCVKSIWKSRFRSYKGEIRTIAKNQSNRRFSTLNVLQKLTADLTEFKCTRDEKLYLSPIMDLYNGEIIGVGMAKRPILDFVMASLHHVLPIIEKQAVFRTTIHFDQCWHYRHRARVGVLKKQRIFQMYVSKRDMCRQRGQGEFLRSPKAGDVLR